MPELIDGYGDLDHGDLLTAGESPNGSLTVVVDDDDVGFQRSGPATRHDSGGFRASFWYAPASATPTTSATWTPDVPQTGVYEIAAFIPYSYHATSTVAPFTVLAHGATDTTTQDQSIIGGDFHALFGGRGFKLVEGGAARLELHNGTAESGVDVAFDAIRFRQIAEIGDAGAGDLCDDSVHCADDLLCHQGTCRAPCTESGCASGGACDPATGLCDLWPEDPGTSSGTPTEPTEPTQTDDAGETSDPTVIKPTVACQTGPAGGSSGSWLLLAFAMLCRRRSPIEGRPSAADRGV